MFHVFDRWGNPKPAPMTVLAARRTQNVDGTDNLDLLSDLDLEKGDRVAWRDHMGLWREWVVNSTDTSRSDRLPLSTAHCVDAIQELASTYIEDKRNRSATASACAKKALAGTRWILGTVHDGTKTTEADLAFYHTDALSAIQDICATFGLEAVTTYQPDATGTRIATRTLSLVSRRGAATPTKRFTYGKDLASIRRTIDATQVATRLYGWGKGVATTDDDGEETGGYSRKISFADINGGKAYVEDATALALWGVPGPDGTRIHSEADAEFPDCEDPKQLLTLTKEALKTRSQPVVSYECDVTSLAAAGVNAEGPTSATPSTSSTPASPRPCASKDASCRSNRTSPATRPPPPSPSATSPQASPARTTHGAGNSTSSSPTPAHGTTPPPAPNHTSPTSSTASTRS